MPESSQTHQNASIRVSGADAKEFLQGQLSNDMALLDTQPQLLAAWCNPKGRVICIVDISKDGADYLLSLPAELAEAVSQRLLMFRFRAKVEFTVEDSSSGRVIEGLPCIGTAQTEKFTPHMLNLDLLDAISFDKGCYTGQEIVARTHYRGATRRRTLRFDSREIHAVGDKVADGERDIGEVINVNGTELLAVVPVDRADAGLTVNGVELQHRPLPFL